MTCTHMDKILLASFVAFGASEHSVIVVVVVNSLQLSAVVDPVHDAARLW